MVEYTIDDIRGPTVAREMAQLKSFVLEKFNGAIADAEAAAAAAAQAVLDSLDARVGALEGDMTTVQGAILTLDGSVVKLAGTQTITGTKNVPLEATGTASNQIASSQKVKNELDNYAPMVRTSGNQSISGTKTMTAYQALINKKGNSWKGPTSTFYLGPFLNVVDVDDSQIGSISYSHDANGTNHVVFDVRAYTDDGQGNYTVQKRAYLNIEVRASDGKARMTFVSPAGTTTVIQDWIA
jgi:hypothetical protein